MAHGSIQWVCRTCKLERAARRATGEDAPTGALGRCRHAKAQYYVVVPIGSRRKWIQAGRDLRRAEAFLSEMITSLNQGTYVEPVRGFTFAMFADEWIKNYAATKKTKTRETYTSYVNAQLKPAFGKLPLPHITEQRVQIWLAKQKEAGAAPKTLRNWFVTLKLILRCAVRWKKLRINPLAEMKPPERVKRIRDYLHPAEALHLITGTNPIPKATGGSVRWVCSACREERARRRKAGDVVPRGPLTRCSHVGGRYYLLRPIAETDRAGKRRYKWIALGKTLEHAEKGCPFIAPRWFAPIKATIFSGLREGELFALAIRHLDFTRCQIRVEREVVFASKQPADGKPRWEFEPPKSKAAVRCVDVSRELMKELERHIQTLPTRHPDQLLFPTSAGTPLDPKLAGPRGLYPALKRAKITKHITWHDLRHTYAAIQIDAGAEAMYLKEQMGHESIQVTYDVYGHLLRRRDPGQAAKAYARVFGEQARSELRAIRMEGEFSDIRSNAVLTARQVEDVLDRIQSERNVESCSSLND